MILVQQQIHSTCVCHFPISTLPLPWLYLRDQEKARFLLHPAPLHYDVGPFIASLDFCNDKGACKSSLRSPWSPEKKPLLKHLHRGSVESRGSSTSPSPSGMMRISTASWSTVLPRLQIAQIAHHRPAVLQMAPAAASGSLCSARDGHRVLSCDSPIWSAAVVRCCFSTADHRSFLRAAAATSRPGRSRGDQRGGGDEEAACGGRGGDEARSLFFSL